MKITQVRIAAVQGKNNLLGYAEITVDNCFRVRDLRIFRRPTGYHIAMPQMKEKGGQYREIVSATNARARKLIEEAVITEYEKITGKRMR